MKMWTKICIILPTWFHSIKMLFTPIFYNTHLLDSLDGASIRVRGGGRGQEVQKEQGQATPQSIRPWTWHNAWGQDSFWNWKGSAASPDDKSLIGAFHGHLCYS